MRQRTSLGFTCMGVVMVAFVWASIQWSLFPGTGVRLSLLSPSDLGLLWDRSVDPVVVLIKNESANFVVIDNITTSCTCIKVTNGFPIRVEPQAVHKIEVAPDWHLLLSNASEGVPVSFQLTPWVAAAEPIAWHFTANVRKGLHVSCDQIRFGISTADPDHHKVIGLNSVSLKLPMNAKKLDVRTPSEDFNILIRPDSSLNKTVDLIVEPTPGLGPQSIASHVDVYATDAVRDAAGRLPSYRLPINIDITGAVYVEPVTSNLGLVDVGATVVTYFVLGSTGLDFVILKSSVEGACARLERCDANDLPPGSQCYRLSVTANSIGRSDGRVRFSIDESKRSYELVAIFSWEGI